MALRVVVDTNVLIAAIPRKSLYHWLFKNFLEKRFDLFFSNKILTEYEEQFSLRWDADAAAEISSILLEARNSFFFEVHFFFNLIHKDEDDNKFVDCAIAAGADYLVTFDKHFNVLKSIAFPKIIVLHPDEFKPILTP